jgi:hypothetical protein
MSPAALAALIDYIDASIDAKIYKGDSADGSIVSARYKWEMEDRLRKTITEIPMIDASPVLIECARLLRDLLAMCERQRDFNDDGDGDMLNRCAAALTRLEATEPTSCKSQR